MTKRVLTTLIPPEQPATWYSRTRPCRHCVAKVLTVRGSTMRVEHSRGCEALKSRPSKRGRDVVGRAGRDDRETRPLTSRLPLEGLL